MWFIEGATTRRTTCKTKVSKVEIASVRDGDIYSAPQTCKTGAAKAEGKFPVSQNKSFFPVVKLGEDF